MSSPSTRADPVPGEVRTGLPLMFAHIPRTAGSTLKFMLQSSFGLKGSLLDAHLYRTADEDLRQFSFVEGHLAAHFFAWSLGANWFTNGLTMLRDPVDRTVSQARHIRARPGRLQPKLHATVRDPDEVFERVPRLINVQTKFLGRVPADAPHVEREALSEAKGLLDHLAFGVTEAFDTSVALFVERFRLRVPKFDIRNVAWATGDDDLQSAEFRAAARRNNELDVELYTYATTLLNSRVQRFTGNLLGLDARRRGCRLRRAAVSRQPGRGPHRAPDRRDVGEALGLDPRRRSRGRRGAGARRRTADSGPLAVERDDAARLTQDIGNRFAGFLGTIAIPADARVLEIIAFDLVGAAGPRTGSRSRGPRPSHRSSVRRPRRAPGSPRPSAASSCIPDRCGTASTTSPGRSRRATVRHTFSSQKFRSQSGPLTEVAACAIVATRPGADGIRTRGLRWLARDRVARSPKG